MIQMGQAKTLKVCDPANGPAITIPSPGVPPHRRPAVAQVLTSLVQYVDERGKQRTIRFKRGRAMRREVRSASKVGSGR
jgi:hypothetical protein